MRLWWSCLFLFLSSFFYSFGIFRYLFQWVTKLHITRRAKNKNTWKNFTWANCATHTQGERESRHMANTCWMPIFMAISMCWYFRILVFPFHSLFDTFFSNRIGLYRDDGARRINYFCHTTGSKYTFTCSCNCCYCIVVVGVAVALVVVVAC